ncbi:sulfurtransferase [Dactylosporangium darangshiense]|uniref:Sulfurtransferase n=1 Tax=Dactylosporangium darangshiense TaxID=579108 RepID=A0ABP8DQE1_9ACTN
MSDPRTQHLITARELIDHPVPHPVVLHVGRRSATLPAAQAKIAGAHVTELEEDFAASGYGERGRLPLPDVRSLTDRVQSWGIDGDTPVIVYAARPELVSAATRAWFVLRWAGLPDVRLLDGGLDAWRAEGGGTEDIATAAPAAPSTFAASPGHLPTIDADRAAQFGARGGLLDARDQTAYDGGHIPGARLVPSPVFENGRLKSAETLRSALPIPAAVYCGAGVSATTVAFAYATLGRTVPVYVASWSGWTADADRPIEQA